MGRGVGFAREQVIGLAGFFLGHPGDLPVERVCRPGLERVEGPGHGSPIAGAAHAVEGRVAAGHMEGRLPALGFGQDVQGDEGQAGVDLREGALDLLAGGERWHLALVQRIVAIGTLHGQHGSGSTLALPSTWMWSDSPAGRNVEEVEAAVFQVEITPDGGVLISSKPGRR